MTIDEVRELITDEMLDAAQEAVGDVFRVDAERIIAAALFVMYNSEED